MFTCCWSVKGGSGVSVVAAALALRSSRVAPAALVDLCGDLPAVLGLSEPDGPGAGEWSAAASTSPPPLVAVTPTLSLLPRGSAALDGIDGAMLAALAADVVVDAGCLERLDDHRAMLVASSERSLLVIRPCYLALRRATRLALRPHGIVVISEPGRALASDDIAAVVGAPVVAEVPVHAAIGRAVDAGLLVTRCPAPLTAALAGPS